MVRDTRDRVLAAAQAEFAERGLHATSIEDVAARAGLTKGAVYYYFRDKEDLAGDVQIEMWERLGREAVRQIGPADGALENLRGAFGAFLEGLEGAGEARFFLRDSWATRAARDERARGVELVRAVLETGIDSGELPPDLDPEATARVLLGAFAEATLHILGGGSREATMKVVDGMIDSLGRFEQASGSTGRVSAT